MTEPELRALVRDAVARELSRPLVDDAPIAGSEASAPPAVPQFATLRQHASHGMFMLEPEAGGACLIEPAVACNHCGFCKSYGH
jgi:hypothetical protein